MIQLDTRRASWVGDADTGCYFDVWEISGVWHWAVWYDAGHDCGLLATGECGSLVTNIDEAREIPRSVCQDWCRANEVDWESL